MIQLSILLLTPIKVALGDTWRSGMVTAPVAPTAGRFSCLASARRAHRGSDELFNTHACLGTSPSQSMALGALTLTLGSIKCHLPSAPDMLSGADPEQPEAHQVTTTSSTNAPG